MMKKPSIQQLALNARDALIRFPLVLLSAFIGSMVGIYLVEVNEVTQDVFPFINVMLCAVLGIPLYFSVQIWLEKSQTAGMYDILLPVLATVILVFIYFSLPGQDTSQNTFQPYIRYAIYNACLHLVVSFSPFVMDKDIDGFWHYNITLLIRVLAAFLYAMVLFLGIMLALLALHLLFDLEFDNKIYPQLFILMIGFFNTLFFLSGVPKELHPQEGIDAPKELKVFAQYILLPLLAVYLLILYGYGAKIVMIWDWPRGIVSYLIICVAVLGVTTFLLLYPYTRWEGNKWIKKATFAFCCLMIPLLVLLFIALSMRVGDYGFTVNRYLLFVLGIWMAMVCLYFILGKGNIKFIPISLAALFFLSSFGPWGVFTVSENSQIDRLRSILSQVNLLANDEIQGEIIWDKDQLPSLDSPGKYENMDLLTDSLYNEVLSILYYLEDFHGFKNIRPWFSQDMNQILAVINQDKLKWQRMQEVPFYMQTMGLDPYRGPNVVSPGFFSFQADLRDAATDVRDYEFLIQFSINESETKEYAINGISYLLQFDERESSVSLASDYHQITIPLAPLMERLINDYQGQQDRGFHTVSPSQLIYEGEGIGGFKLLIHHVNYERTGSDGELKFMSGLLLLRKAPQAPSL
ncbi:MAG TPA: DUF4153 domain-containing protein [Cyclobacteriaceae bacterium]|nr:DUF4153 domain-containing protein [Cyclobacteriaceae bacterium]